MAEPERLAPLPMLTAEELDALLLCVETRLEVNKEYPLIPEANGMCWWHHGVITATRHLQPEGALVELPRMNAQQLRVLLLCVQTNLGSDRPEHNPSPHTLIAYSLNTAVAEALWSIAPPDADAVRALQA